MLQAVAAVREAHLRVPAVMRRLMRHLDLTDADLGEALGGVKRQTVNSWANGRTRIPVEIEGGLATLFDMPREVLYLSPDEAIRWVLDHPSDLRIVRKRCLAFCPAA